MSEKSIMDIKKDCNLHHVIENGDLSHLELLMKNIYINAVDEFHESALHIAVIRNKIEIAKYLIRNGADINIKEKHSGMTPLHLAIKLGNVEMTKLLIAEGASVNKITRHNLTVLHIAIEVGNEELVEIILNNFSIIDARKFGKNPLHHAVECKNVRFVKLLLDRGSNINDTCIDGQTVMHIAVENKDQEMVKFLLDHGAKIYEDEFGICPLHQAVESGLTEIVKLLLSSENCDNNIYQNKSMFLGLAFKKNNEIMVNILLENRANPDLKSFVKTPLYLAIECEWEDTVKFLLSKGADVSTASRGNISALDVVLANKNSNIAKLLTKHGADVKIQNRINGTRPLHTAVKNESLEMVQLLLSKRACPNIASNVNVSPLQTAVKNECLEMAQLLFSKNACPDIASNVNVTPLQIAFDLMHREMVETLTAYNADTNISKSSKSQIELSIKYKWLDIIYVLLEKGINDDDVIREKNNMLFMAIKQKNLEALELLLDFGADPNYINQKSMSPLQSAVIRQFKDAVELLIERGADVNYTMQDGSTAFNTALNIRSEHCVKYLLENGASIHVKEGHMPPLHVAAGCKWLDIAKTLLDKGENVDERDVLFCPPLIYAVNSRDKNMICLLLEYKANIHCKYRDSLSPLHVAVENQYPEIVELLLDNGANVNELIEYSFEIVCALHIALKNGDEEMFKILIKRGADITIKGQKTERTPLHLAAQFGCIEAAKIFLKNNVEVDKIDEFGATPLWLAMKRNDLQMVELLIKHGARLHLTGNHFITSLKHAVERNNHQLVELLLLYDFDENDTISFNYTKKFMKVIHALYPKRDFPILSIILQHLARKGMYLTDLLLIRHNDCIGIRNLRNEIHKELNSMKGDKFYESYTFYKILTTKTSQLSMLTNNRYLLQAFEDTLKKNSAKYPYYHDLLSKIMERAKEKKSLRDRCEASLSELFKIELPYMINQQILSYLPNISLRFLDIIFQENLEDNQENRIM